MSTNARAYTRTLTLSVASSSRNTIAEMSKFMMMAVPTVISAAKIKT